MTMQQKYPGASIDAIVWLAKYDRTDEEVTPENILCEICAIFNALPVLLKSRNRGTELVYLRKIFYYVSWRITQCPFKQLGEYMTPPQDHTTVMHAKDHVIDMLAVSDEKFLSYWNRYIAATQIYSPAKHVKRRTVVFSD